MLKNKILWIIMFLGIINLFTAFLDGMDGRFGGKMYPYTGLITNTLDVNLFVGVLLIIGFFTGEIIWKERHHRFATLQRMKDYLQARGNAADPELPLTENAEQIGGSQLYVAYFKAGVVMNAVRSIIGEDSLNQALQEFLLEFKYSENYPTPEHFLNYLRAAWPEHMSQELLEDWYDRITLYEFEASKASVDTIVNGFVINLEVHAQKYYATGTGEQQAAKFRGPLDIHRHIR